MKSETKMGLLAFGVVFGLVAIMGLVAAIALPRGTDKGNQATGGDKELTAPISNGSKDDPVAYICGHRWWSKPPSKKQLDDLVDQIIALNQQGEAVIDGDAKFILYGAYIQWLLKQKEPQHKRKFTIKAYWTKRPNREQVLGEIKAKLDQLEYQEGPGR